MAQSKDIGALKQDLKNLEKALAGDVDRKVLSNRLEKSRLQLDKVLTKMDKRLAALERD